MAFKEQSLVRHTKMPTWGIGRVLKTDDELVWIDFSSGGLKKLKVEIAAEHLVAADLEAPTAKPAASAPRAVAHVGSRSRSNARCAHCEQLLQRSQHRNNGAMKSCPRCSAFEGEHVFYPYPDAFAPGASGADPARDQSDCRACRANASLPHAGGTPCSQLADTP
jgi:hypothetical protein